ncbi:MAG TPA: hypothetical protein VLT33_25525, partial [Labilithrix sp.]|nr:hypothetical protein [Labilithrix sp.]
MSRPLCVLAVTALLASGCAQPLQPFGRAAGGGGPPCAFWPPPPPTSTWMGELDAATGRSFGEAAGDLASMLREAGYDALQWYPIGARHDHGFAVTTRLERIDDDGTPRPPSERWSSLYPDAMSLR